MSVLYRFDFTNPSEALTKREKEIQDMVNQGFTSKEIAERLCLSKHTVDTHRRRIKKK